MDEPRSASLHQYTVVLSELTGNHLVQVQLKLLDTGEVVELRMNSAVTEVFAEGLKGSASQARAMNRIHERDQ